MIYRFVIRVEVPDGDREDRPEIQQAIADSVFYETIVGIENVVVLCERHHVKVAVPKDDRDPDHLAAAAQRLADTTQRVFTPRVRGGTIPTLTK